MEFWDVGSKLGDFFHLRGSVGFFGQLYCQFDAYVEFFVCLLVSDKQGWLGGVYNHFYPCFVVFINQDEGPKVREGVHTFRNDVPYGASYKRVLLKGSKEFLSDVLVGLPVHTSILIFLNFFQRFKDLPVYVVKFLKVSSRSGGQIGSGVKFRH